MKWPLISALVILMCVGLASAQDPYPGLTIISERVSFDSHLIDMDGNVVKTWHGADAPGEFAYMLPDSSVLRPCRVPEAEGRGGRIQHIDADDNVIWDFIFATDDYLQHHDIEPMPNGNVILVAWERHTIAEALAAGRQSLNNDMKVTYLVEIEPVGATGGNIVWEWRAWDHLVQNFDPTLENYGLIADHPELIDINYGEVPAGTWLHANAIDYNEELDQIVFCARNSGEIYVIDHSTTIEEAAGHTGGRWGHGGDILYRWGNPQAYMRGDELDQVFWGPHGAIWIDEGLPGAGNILVFNNGDRPGTASDLSSVEEILPPQDEPGVYTLEPGMAFGPATPVWRYGDIPDFYSATLGGAYRMPNANTLICEGREGRIFEVTPAGSIVWVYLSVNTIHRAPRYWDMASPVLVGPAAAHLMGNYPNPFNPITTISFSVEEEQRVTLRVFDAAGRLVATLTDRIFGTGYHSVTWEGVNDQGRVMPSGLYMVQMETGDGAEVRKISLVR